MIILEVISSLSIACASLIYSLKNVSRLKIACIECQQQIPKTDNELIIEYERKIIEYEHHTLELETQLLKTKEILQKISARGVNSPR
jgi:hypothetical protein